MHIIFLVFAFIFVGCSHHPKQLSPKLDLYCRDLNLLLGKINTYSANIGSAETNKNIKVTEQMSLMIQTQRVLDVVLASAPVKKDFFLNDPRAELCFNKYPEVEQAYNYKRMLER